MVSPLFTSLRTSYEYRLAPTDELCWKQQEASGVKILSTLRNVNREDLVDFRSRFYDRIFYLQLGALDRSVA